jgi:hypothetical protein
MFDPQPFENPLGRVISDSRRSGCRSQKPYQKAIPSDRLAHFIDPKTAAGPDVPSVALAKPQLIATLRDQNLKSVSSVFKALAGGVEDTASKPALASLLVTIWNDEYEDERDARFINDRVHGNIQKDGTFSVIPEMPGGVSRPMN